MSECWSTVIGWYREPLFWLFPVASALVSMFMFLVFAGPLAWLAAADPAWARKYRIQSRHDRHVSTGEALRQWFSNNVQALVGASLLWPLFRLSSVHAGELPAWWVIAAQLLFFIYLDDFLYYWVHRGMHTRWLLKHVHGVHHRIYAPRALSGHYMHPVEYALTGLLVLIGPMLVGAHVLTIWLWVTFRQWEAAEGHCGYDFPWSPTRWLPFSDGALHHDFHHARIKGNFAGFLRWTDRAFGTLLPGYEVEKEQLRGKQLDTVSIPSMKAFMISTAAGVREDERGGGRLRRWATRSAALALMAVFAFYGLLAIDSARSVLFGMLGDDTAVAVALDTQRQAEAGVAVEQSPEVLRYSPVWIALMASATSTRFGYGLDSVWNSEIHYAAMPAFNQLALSVHMFLGGCCMLLGVFQFWPAFRRQRPQLHRRFGMIYAGSAQLAMILAVVYLSLTSVDNTYGGLTFHVGLWFLAIATTASLWMAIYHVRRREIAQHQAWMAMNFGFLLTAPLLRYDWTLLGLLFPSIRQNEVNLSVMVFLIPQSLLGGYLLLCLNRRLQKERREPQALALPAAARRLLPYGGPLLALAALAIAWGVVQHYLLAPGLAGSAAARALVPAGVVELESRVLADAAWGRGLYVASTLLVLALAPFFVYAAFREERIEAHRVARLRVLALTMAVATASGALVQLGWGYALGAPSHAALSGGTFYVLNGTISLVFALALGAAARAGRLPLMKEWGVFTLASLPATPAIYGNLAGLQRLDIPAPFIDAGHAYMIAAGGGVGLLLLAFAYSAYGSATREKLAC